jgi:hypothetical protein
VTNITSLSHLISCHPISFRITAGAGQLSVCEYVRTQSRTGHNRFDADSTIRCHHTAHETPGNAAITHSTVFLAIVKLIDQLLGPFMSPFIVRLVGYCAHLIRDVLALACLLVLLFIYLTYLTYLPYLTRV